MFGKSSKAGKSAKNAKMTKSQAVEASKEAKSSTKSSAKDCGKQFSAKIEEDNQSSFIFYFIVYFQFLAIS